MKRYLKALLAITAAFSLQTNAALITLNSASIDTTTFDNSDIAGAFEALSGSATTSYLNSFTIMGTGKKKVNRLAIELDMDSANTFTFDAGLDATFGAEWYVNGELVAKTTNDIWWSRNWNSAAVFSISDIELGRGTNVIELFWAEDCCDGRSSVRFSALNAQNAELTLANLETSEVPEPAPLALLGLSVALMSLRRRKA